MTRWLGAHSSGLSRSGWRPGSTFRRQRISCSLQRRRAGGQRTGRFAAARAVRRCRDGRAGVDTWGAIGLRRQRSRCVLSLASGFACPEPFGALRRRHARHVARRRPRASREPDRVSRSLSPGAGGRRQDNTRRRVRVSRRSAAACRRLPTGARRPIPDRGSDLRRRVAARRHRPTNRISRRGSHRADMW